MTGSIRLTTVVVLFTLSAFCATSAMAQDPAKVAPDVYKVRLDNARVRVLEVTGKAGQKAAMHKHPGYVVYSVGGGSVKFTDAKGVVGDPTDMQPGSATWRDAETHASEVVSDIHALLFELKGAGAAHAAKPAAGVDPVTADPSHFKVLLDNEHVRVLEFTAAAGDKIPMHWHPDYITYNISGGRTTFSYPKRKPVVSDAKAGDAAWHKTETHAGLIGDGGAHVLLVEIK
jgi:quercetin dioxygenase-like cupin family protein